MINCENVEKKNFLSLFKDNSHTGDIAGFGATEEEAMLNGMKNLKKKYRSNFHSVHKITDLARKIAEKHIGEKFAIVDELYYCQHCDLIISKTEMEELCSNCANKPTKECVKM